MTIVAAQRKKHLENSEEDEDEANEYSESDVEMLVVDTKRIDKEKRKKESMVKTTLRVSENCGVKVGMRMMISSVNKPFVSDKFVVYKMGSTILKRGVEHDDAAGSTIVQTHAMAGSQGSDSAVSCTVVAQRQPKTNRNEMPNSSDDEKQSEAESSGSQGAVSEGESDLSIVDALFSHQQQTTQNRLASTTAKELRTVESMALRPLGCLYHHVP